MFHQGTTQRLKSPYTNYDLIQVIEQSPPASWGAINTYRGSGRTNDGRDPYQSVAMSITYVTGGHAFRVSKNFM